MGVPAETVEQNYQTDYTIDPVVPTKTGYTFQGWSDGTTTYQPGAAFKVPARECGTYCPVEGQFPSSEVRWQWRYKQLQVAQQRRL